MTATGECKRSLEIEVPAGEVEREATRIAQGFQRQARIPGFRPGKAPLSLVRQHFNAKIREETLDTLVPAHLKAACERASLEPVSTPTLEGLQFEAGAPLKFTANFEVLPAIELGDYRAIRAALPPLEVAAAEVDQELEGLREHHSRNVASEAVELADGLIGVVAARRLPAAPEAPAEAAAPREAEQEQELPIAVGAAETLPEFSAALRGMRPGEERELEVHYPAEFPNAAIAGKSQRYHLRLLRIEKKQIPELDDAFALQATAVETLAELRQRILESLRAQRRHEARHQVEEAIVDQLVAQSPFPVPGALVDQQVEAKLERNLRSLADQGVDPRKLKLDWSKLRAKHQEAAEREVRASLLMERIAAREQIEARSEEVEAELQRAAAELGQTPEALRARLTDQGVLDRIKNRIRQEKVVDFLVTQATSGGFDQAASGAAKELASS